MFGTVAALKFVHIPANRRLRIGVWSFGGYMLGSMLASYCFIALQQYCSNKEIEKILNEIKMKYPKNPEDPVKPWWVKTNKYVEGDLKKCHKCLL